MAPSICGIYLINSILSSVNLRDLPLKWDQYIHEALTFQWAFFLVRLISRYKWHIIYLTYIDIMFLIRWWIFHNGIFCFFSPDHDRQPEGTTGFELPVDTKPWYQGTRGRNFLSITFSYLLKFMEDGWTKILALVFFSVFENCIFYFSFWIFLPNFNWRRRINFTDQKR